MQLHDSGGLAIGDAYYATDPGTDTVIIEGNVGIGTTNPLQKLEVAGRIRMTTWTADGDTAVYRDDATGDIGLQTSDIRLKKNLTPITGALDTVLGLQGYLYNTLDEPDGHKKRLGLVAQDLVSALPEATFNFTNEQGEE